jgi:hypothetical protein
LGRWVNEQRQDLTKIKLFQRIGFEWEVQTKLNEELWADWYEELVEYKQQNGHCNVSQRDKDNNQK